MKQGFPFATAGQRVGLLGGSFDPAHEGHVLLTEEALKRFGLDRVWWLVTPGNPLKAHQPAPLAERIAHAQKLMDDPRVEVTGIEAELGTQKTVDTIAALQKHYPNLHFTWLMGSDNLVQFSRWERWREIAARVPIGVLSRPGTRLAARLSKAARVMASARLPERRASQLGSARPPAWVMVNMPMSSASSSAIRAARETAAPKG
ncbi:MAG TPA: nicotinate-nucleotide adenylyltransferase [Paracoccus sp. (in: a-proteobacteria)]|uniref:nicotinate-nucleotide adenylyltransferase n=1 Tax=uncultured Paracoccus sp. TaxID=189685 RepID=UPI00261D4593|nr:nicotinate-nucleotide adenylyltransferase [uncultured Paracoccus sp.]HMQ40723.1 nicotinate-nucleotide adenylyltransferase [Paracoccus sp. (in: a-proteobacteria)]HMR37621.1 nicotinate-nucleotide adenylyltransferase [Paracoccus sp. (in: a-proteobacteria)]